MFHCGRCSCAEYEEQEPVASALVYRHSRYETDAISNNWSLYQRRRRRRRQESPSYDELNKFDIDEQTPKRQSTSKAATARAQRTEAAANAYFTGRKKLSTIHHHSNNNQSQIQRALSASPITRMTQQQQQQQRRIQQQQ